MTNGNSFRLLLGIPLRRGSRWCQLTQWLTERPNSLWKRRRNTWNLPASLQLVKMEPSHWPNSVLLSSRLPHLEPEEWKLPVPLLTKRVPVPSEVSTLREGVLPSAKNSLRWSWWTASMRKDATSWWIANKAPIRSLNIRLPSWKRRIRKTTFSSSMRSSWATTRYQSRLRRIFLLSLIMMPESKSC
jgi:hypothetical protein